MRAKKPLSQVKAALGAVMLTVATVISSDVLAGNIFLDSSSYFHLPTAGENFDNTSVGVTAGGQVGSRVFGNWTFSHDTRGFISVDGSANSSNIQVTPVGFSLRRKIGGAYATASIVMPQAGAISFDWRVAQTAAWSKMVVNDANVFSSPEGNILFTPFGSTYIGEAVGTFFGGYVSGTADWVGKVVSFSVLAGDTITFRAEWAGSDFGAGVYITNFDFVPEAVQVPEPNAAWLTVIGMVACFASQRKKQAV
jgi:hypothetical protein